jgi:hypothetical protein
MLNAISIPVDFTAVRINRSATILLHDNIARVFPLFGPVREADWAEGWAPEILYGYADAEEHMVFRTKGEGEYYQWIITQFDPQRFQIEYTVTAAERVWFIRVECKPYQNETLATVSYTYIGLTEDGHTRNKKAMDRIFAHNLGDWEEAVNHYLSTGKKLIH